MPASLKILPGRGLVYVRYEGFLSFDQTMDLMAEYMAHPDRHPGQKQLVDLSKVTGCEQDFVRLMALQAEKADLFAPHGEGQTILVYYAPTEISYDIAKMVLRSWLGVNSVVATIQRHESDALDMVGQPERRMDALLATAR